MKILMLSKDGDGLGIAHRLVKEGHSVSVWIKSKEFEGAGQGMVDRVNSWRSLASGADLVLCDMVGFGQYEELFKRWTRPVLCCNALADAMELDRAKGRDVLKRMGISVPPSQSYNSPAEAKVVLSDWRNEAGYVLKPNGNISTALTFLCRTPAVFEWALERYSADQELLVQDIIDNAVEVSTEGWFNGSDWITPFNHTFEEKRFMTGSAGPMVGCMGNIVIAARGENKLVKATIGKMTPLLRKIGYRGPLDINALVREDKLFALELTCRFGYDAIEALIEGLKEPLGSMLFDTAVGIKKSMNVTTDYMMAVRVSLPPYPSDLTEDDHGDRGMPLPGLNAQNEKHVFLTDVMKENGKFVYAATDGVLCKVTAVGRSVSEASNRVYRTIHNLAVPDAQYRTDIGSRVGKDMERLKQWGWT